MARQIVITGGTSGIGAAIARRFVAEGDVVTLTGRDPERVRTVAGELGARGAVCDITSVASVEAFAATLDGPLDVVIAMAGGNAEPDRDEAQEPLSAVALADAAWTANLRTNTIGTALTVTALVPKLRAGGAIIMVSSIGAEYASGPYGASKAAVAAWTAGLSAQVGPDGLTVNTIAPGYIEDTAFFGDTMTEQRRQRLIEATHTKRPGRPEDVAGLAFFLAGPDSRHITGQTIHVNGGAHTTR